MVWGLIYNVGTVGRVERTLECPGVRANYAEVAEEIQLRKTHLRWKLLDRDPVSVADTMVRPVEITAQRGVHCPQFGLQDIVDQESRLDHAKSENCA